MLSIWKLFASFIIVDFFPILSRHLTFKIQLTLTSEPPSVLRLPERDHGEIVGFAFETIVNEHQRLSPIDQSLELSSKASSAN